MSDIQPLFHGEVQLAGWSESHNGGCKVTFWLSDSSDLDAFRAMTVRKGNQAGQRLACALVEINDDETPVQQPAAASEPPAPKGGPLARLAAQWCASPDFQEWLRTLGVQCDNADDAADFVRKVCHIKSRAELDNEPAAARFFQREIRAPFMNWMQRGRE